MNHSIEHEKREYDAVPTGKYQPKSVKCKHRVILLRILVDCYFRHKMFATVTNMTTFECLEGHPTPKSAMRHNKSYQVFPPTMIRSQELMMDPRELLFELEQNPYCKHLYALTCRHSQGGPAARQTLVITDTTRPKKGWFPKRSMKRFCVKRLRSRTIYVFNVEWMATSPEVKREDTDHEGQEMYYKPSFPLPGK